MRILATFALILIMQACKHPLAIEGKGDIVERLIGQRGCSLEEFQANGPRCTENEVVDDDYSVSYEAVPRPGWRFLRWAGGTSCSPNSVVPYCDYSIPSELVNFFDETRPDTELQPTVAVFVQHPMQKVNVGAKRNGGFGPFLGGVTINPAVKDMVAAAVLLAGETITLTATGEINVATNSPMGIFTPPDGTDFPPSDRPTPYYYFPLEEAKVDAGELTVPVPGDVTLDNVGALIGAFVAEETVKGARFLAHNDDPDPDVVQFAGAIPRQFKAGDIPSDSLFLIGSGPFKFTAPQNGALFLGINDASVTNNEGMFAVSIELE